MHPTIDPDSESKPDELPSDAKLQAGYIRYIRILTTEGPKGEICLETCIRRSLSDDDSYEDRISKRLPYTAISYSWGDPTPSHPVIADGQERLLATNLWHFLQRAIDAGHKRSQRLEIVRSEWAEWKNAQFGSPAAYLFFKKNFGNGGFSGGFRRRLSKERRRGEDFAFQRRLDSIMAEPKDWSEDWLWIDALCIDQLDARERTHQVGIMSEIFGRADQVVAWLGPPYDNSEHAMTTIAGYSSDPHYCEHQILRQTELSKAISSLCERPYWKRLWVFQELRHAQEIILMCGKKKISWDKFKQLWLVVVDIATRDAMELLKQSLATRMMTLRSKPIDFSLWNLLKETQTLECSNQRDRVYALLSVATAGHEGIEADYDLHPLYLAHRILHIKYNLRRPGSLDDVLLDCRFLEGVFGMDQGTMLRYRRHDAGGHNGSDVRLRWCQWEWYMMKDARYVERTRSFETPHQDQEEAQSAVWSAPRRRLSQPTPPSLLPVTRSGSSQVNTESPQAALSWSVWAQSHEHDAVTRLL